MSRELTILALAIVLGFVQIVLAAHAASHQRGYRWAASARDEPTTPLTGIAGRLERALQNFAETFPLFAAAILIAHIAGREGQLTLWGAHLSLAARIAYLALYAYGVYLIRSIIWNIAALGIGMILFALW